MDASGLGGSTISSFLTVLEMIAEKAMALEKVAVEMIAQEMIRIVTCLIFS